jgi:hypothetical protein
MSIISKCFGEGKKSFSMKERLTLCIYGAGGLTTFFENECEISRKRTKPSGCKRVPEMNQKRPTINTARHEKNATVIRLRLASESTSAVTNPTDAVSREPVEKKIAGTVMAERTA